MELREIQALVNERDELEHRRLAVSTRLIRFRKDSSKFHAGLDEARSLSVRIDEIDALLDERGEVL